MVQQQEEMLIEDLKKLDSILGNITAPPLTRADHDSIRQLMSVVLQRIKLSFKLEKEIEELNKSTVELNKEED